VRRAAPDAEILLVGPVAGDAQAAALQPSSAAVLAFAKGSHVHYVDGVSHHWVGGQIDATYGLPTADALVSVGTGLGHEVERLLAG
jgi:hypothetical protein